MKATVVIPTYNRSARLRELLVCLTHQRGDALCRVVVCDDGSTDDTAAVAQSFAGALPMVYCRQENLGFRAGQARNMGIARADGDVIVFVDDDVLVADDFVVEHVRAHTNAEPRVAIGYRHRTHQVPTAPPPWEVIASAEPDDRTEVLGDGGAGVSNHPTPWFFVYSCNFSVARSHGRVEFDDEFVGWGMEDIEFGYRLFHNGYRVVAAPRARVLHVEDPRPRDPFRCEARSLPPTYDSYVRNSIYFMDKYPHDAALAALIRTDMRWYVRDEERGAWVKNGYANDVDSVINHCRRERALRRAAARGPGTAPRLGEETP